MKVYAISNPGLVVPKRRGKWIGWAVAASAIVLLAYLVLFTDFYKQAGDVLSANHIPDDFSIAVLPFINDSDDSSNVYFINGLMESTLNDLQKIKELRVISRTSVEKYRSNPKPISEIAKELNVKYIVEGSGQKKGDEIFLHIQLIDASTDRHLLSERYIRESADIFQLQIDIASQIVDKIEVVLTPEEQKRINKTFTDDPEAYDLFMKGLDQLNQGTAEGLLEGISYLHQAIDKDPEYARAYAAIGIAYYYADFFSARKKFTDSVNFYADQALFYDPEIATGLLAKGMFYMSVGEPELSLPFLEKALNYNPNATIVLNMLSDYYTSIEPNTERYLEYAIRGLSLDPAPHDSSQTSIAYLHVANALVQSGFIDEARKYIDRSIEFDPRNIFALYVKEYIRFARDKDIDRLCNGLLGVLALDSTRLDVLQETGKCFFYARDYRSAYRYYSILANTRNIYNIDIYDYENVKIAYVYREMGMEAEADSLMVIYREFFENDQSIYKSLSKAAYHAYYGNTEEALGQIRLFLEEDNYYLWVAQFMDIEPLFDDLKDMPEYQDLLKEIKAKFWRYHEEMRAQLVEKKVI
jgi:TolB-like protein/Tfp pilus assembly protein PilF